MTDSPRPPRVYTIPATAPFGDALVAGLLNGDVISLPAGDPLALARVTLLMPTRRACRAIQDAFLRASGSAAMLLPRILPLGDIDDDEGGLGDRDASVDDMIPPAISSLRRQLLLARLVRAWDNAAPRGEAADPKPRRSMDQVIRLAAELANFLDATQIEGLTLDGLKDLAPAQYADHWQRVLEFLLIVTRHWPEVLAEEGVLDPATRRNTALRKLAQSWEATPPPGPVITAGSTGTVPATADLMGVIARLHQGMIVLPGLDTTIDEEAWGTLDATHPQYALKRLLNRIGVNRGEVHTWPTLPPFEHEAAARATLLHEALRPAETTHVWHNENLIDEAAVTGLALAVCDDLQQEAGVIALRMRAALQIDETTGRRDQTAALVTADRRLARRVVAELKRWGISVDDSAGEPLGNTPPGTLLRLTARLADSGLAPVELLAALKHPLAAGGMPTGEFRALARKLEILCLRGPRPAPGIEGLQQALAGSRDADTLHEWLAGIGSHLTPFSSLWSSGQVGLADLVRAHVGFTEWLAGDDDDAGGTRLWDGEAGDAAAALIADLLENTNTIGALPAGDYAGMLEALMDARAVRPRYGQHPRLFIWGPLEARLQRADIMILGGLNEGSWPPEPGDDPWMSRPMRDAFGLPPHEQRIGLSAHDFVQAASSRNVMFTRARRAGGGPTVPSRWLLRLGALLAAGDMERHVRENGERWLHWHSDISTPPEPQQRLRAPEPRPPVSARPRRMSVTQIEQWMADPYATYARHILELRALDPLDANPGAAERGTIIHNILDAFVRQYPADMPDDALRQLIALGQHKFATVETQPGVFAFWWLRFERIAKWFVETESARRPNTRPAATEVEGRLVLSRPGGDFLLTAKADRIDRLDTGGLVILDYKTGGVPNNKEVARGQAPQLPLELAIAEAGEFKGLPAETVHELEYWRLTGGDPAGEIRKVKGSVEQLGAEAMAGLGELIDLFDDENTPYLPVPRPVWEKPWNDYTHLARVKEWITSTDSGDGDDG